MRSRFALLIVVMVGAYGVLLLHLYELQLIRGGYYTARAASQNLSTITTANRGSIYFSDENGNLLPAAVNKSYPIIYAIPKDLADVPEAANMLAPVVDIPVGTLMKLLSKPDDTYETVVQKADPAMADAVQALNIKGVYVDSQLQRLYPLGTDASQLLGFVGPNQSNAGQSGHYGLELYYDSTLGGSVSGTNVTAGGDITLTLDPNIQVEAEKVLDDLIAKNNATGGSVIIMDPMTGKILAMGSWPNFDPNNYAASPFEDFLNPVAQKIYEPGSVFKVLTMAAGIDAGKFTSSTTYVDHGTVTVSKATISNYDYKTHGAYGLATMTNVIQHSINTGAVYAEGLVGNDIFTTYMKRFGLGEKSGIDVPGELAGNLSRLNPKSPQVAFATASYGQGVAVTPLELINAVAVIANGGNLVRPYVNAALQPQTIRRVLKASSAAEATQMMVSAVDLAHVASIDGYSLAGKTGTAFIPDLVHGGYKDTVIDSYVGFGPTSKPRFIALIKVDTLPQTSLAAQSVVPAFRELSQYIINYYGIPPDRMTK